MEKDYEPDPETERPVIALVIRRKTNKQIAELIGSIGEEGIKDRLSKIFEKAGVTNRKELARVALLKQWHLPPEERKLEMPMCPHGNSCPLVIMFRELQEKKEEEKKK